MHQKVSFALFFVGAFLMPLLFWWGPHTRTPVAQQLNVVGEETETPSSLLGGSSTATPAVPPPTLTKKDTAQEVTTTPREIAVSSTSAQVSTPGPLILESKAMIGAIEVLRGDAIITLTNLERTKLGLPLLSPNNALAAIAEAKTADMIAKQYFAHIAPDGTNVVALAQQHGYQYLNIGENLALGGFHSSDEVVTGWMNSLGHRANILNNNFTEIGVAAIQGTYKGKTVWYVVQEFGRPLSVCPPPDPILKEKITIYQNTLTGLETTLKNLKVEMAASAGDQAILLAKTNDYNTVVSTYNTLVATTKSTITEYNTEAQAFNTCAGL